MNIIYKESSGSNKCLHIKKLSNSTCIQARQKRSDKKEEKKRTNSLLLVEMLNDTIGEYGKLVSIKKILKSTRQDISKLDLVA